MTETAEIPTPPPAQPETPPSLEPTPEKIEPLPIPHPDVSKPKPVASVKPSPAPEQTRSEPTKPAVPAPSPASSAQPATPANVEPSPKPSPAVNVQAQYEEENLAKIRAILAARLTYPKNALRLHQQGEVTASFNLTPSGEVTNLSISRSSEFDLLDSAALKLIETSASEFPKPSKTVRITVPILYKIR